MYKLVLELKVYKLKESERTQKTEKKKKSERTWGKSSDKTEKTEREILGLKRLTNKSFGLIYCV